MQYPATQRHLHLGCGEGLSSWITTADTLVAPATKLDSTRNGVRPNKADMVLASEPAISHTRKGPGAK